MKISLLQMLNVNSGRRLPALNLLELWTPSGDDKTNEQDINKLLHYPYDNCHLLALSHTILTRDANYVPPSSHKLSLSKKDRTRGTMSGGHPSMVTSISGSLPDDASGNGNETNTNKELLNQMTVSSINASISGYTAKSSLALSLISEKNIIFTTTKQNFTLLRSIVKLITKIPSIDQMDKYILSLTDYKVKICLIEADDIYYWHSQYNFVCNIFYFIDLAEEILPFLIYDPELNQFQYQFQSAVESFNKVYLCNYFCDKIRNKSLNIPISIIFINFEEFYAKLMEKYPILATQYTKEQIQEVVFKQFTNIQHRQPLPRILNHSFFDELIVTQKAASKEPEVRTDGTVGLFPFTIPLKKTLNSSTGEEEHENIDPKDLPAVIKQQLQNNKDLLLVFLENQIDKSNKNLQTTFPDIDKIISVAIQHKLERVNASFPIEPKKGIKIQSFQALANALIQPDCTIKELNFHNVQINTKTFIETIGSSLYKNFTLTHIDLSLNFLNDLGMKCLSDGIIYSNQKLLQRLVLCKNNFSSKSIKYICNLLNHLCNKLELLDISHNFFENEGIIKLSQCLLSNFSLTILNLHHCGFSDPGALGVSKVLQFHPSLEFVDISRNRISPSIITILENHLSKNLSSKLTKISIGPLVYSSTLQKLVKENKEKLLIRKNQFQAIVKQKKDPLSNYIKLEEIKYVKNVLPRRPTRTGSMAPSILAPLKQLPPTPAPRHPQPTFYSLDLSNLLIRSLKKVLPQWNLAELKILNLSDNKIKTIPKAFQQLDVIEIISLTNNRLTSLAGIEKLTTLKELYCAKNRLSKVNEISALTNLQLLDIRWNKKIQLLPNGFSKLVNLKRFYVDGCDILYLSTDILKLKSQLFDFTIYNTRIHRILAEIIYASIQQIQYLNLSDLNIHKLPKEIFLLNNLYELNLSINLLTNLPPQISLLSNLRILDLSANRFSKVENLYHLVKLELAVLKLFSNPDLPQQLTQSSNPLSFISDYQSKNMPNTNKIEIHCAKVMIVGNKQVGKSIITKQLFLDYQKVQNQKLHKSSRGAEITPPSLDDPYVATDGIDICEINYKPITGKSANNDPNSTNGIPTTLHLWDFAGESLYHSTHALFLEDRCVYILVFNLSIQEQKQNLLIWLQMINASASNSPIIIVGTHADLLDDQMTAKITSSVVDKYSRNFKITNFISIDAFNQDDIETLRETILSVTLSQPFISKKVKFGYLSLIQSIKSEREFLRNPPVITMKIFEQMAIDCGVDDSAQTSAEYMNQLGFITYFNDKKLGLPNSIVLDPSWFVKLISTIVTSRSNLIQNGILLHSSLAVIWKDYPVSIHANLLDLLVKIELAYTFTSKDGSYSPSPPSFFSFLPLFPFLFLFLQIFIFPPPFLHLHTFPFSLLLPLFSSPPPFLSPYSFLLFLPSSFSLPPFRFGMIF